MKPILGRSPREWGIDIASTATRAGGAMAAVIAACGWAQNRNALAPVNAIAHIVHGDEAFAPHASTWSGPNLRRYTLPALLLNWSAMLGWAGVFELLAPRESGAKRRLAAGAGTSLLAWFVDYRLVPPRLTPGIEAHLSRGAIFVVYLALAVALAARPETREE